MIVFWDKNTQKVLVANIFYSDFWTIILIPE